MRAVLFEIEKIVHDVGSRSAQAERDERQRGFEQDRPAYAFVRRKRGHKNQYVLDPLVGPERTQQGVEAVSRALEHFRDIGDALRTRPHAGPGIHDDRLFAEFPHREIRGGISRVRKARFAHALQRRGLCGTFQVVPVVAAQHGVEKVQVGNRLHRQLLMCSRGEKHGPPVGFFLAQPCHQRFIHRQQTVVQGDAFEDPPLQVAFAAHQPEGNQRK